MTSWDNDLTWHIGALQKTFDIFYEAIFVGLTKDLVSTKKMSATFFFVYKRMEKYIVGIPSFQQWTVNKTNQRVIKLLSGKLVGWFFVVE